MAEIECYRVGTQVKIADGIIGVVTEISIKQTRTILYLVAWWSGREQRYEWFQPWQVSKVDDMTPTTIGFI